MPERIQLRRTKGWRMPANTVKVDRTTKWGNDFPVGAIITDPTGQARITVRDQAHAVELFERHQLPGLRDAAIAELRGRNLGCWCREGTPCHANSLLRTANGDTT